ncbi:phage integrase family protein [Piscinibacter koreensis]|uniref:Tyrosine-type recombinase/integrase n=1 Tax=Piscinibacter koreensis TaxID=2742824 RepID=A0A7Y6TZH0_9BURK|nr:phage integrase family protein [Schlegelella koreensis]NUZ09111.1 tyrosine-type recombinase/integrase [Schlegelella koreensis]
MSTRRKLSSGHFAFMRSVVQGIDARKSWDRYLRVEGEHTDLRRVRSTIAWIRSEFAAAARREMKPGTARLVLFDATELKETVALPSLEEFAIARGLEDFSQAEQQEAYVEAYGTGTPKASRRARLIARQLEALRWLEQLVAQEPGAQDEVGAWFAPTLAARLEKGGMRTLADVVARINGVGARWWTAVPGVGDLKASRIVEWLRLHEGSTGLRLGDHVATRRTKLQPVQLEAVVPRATAIVPFEKFVLPAEVDGRHGLYRAPQHQCMLAAQNDYEAIGAWLATLHVPKDKASATYRAYRKEAERLLLWAIVEHGKPLSSLSVEDANAFKAFLAAPPVRWCGPRHRQRWSPLWRPLEGPLSAGALRQSLIILRSLCGFLVSQNYLIGNAFEGLSLPRQEGRAIGSRRTLTFAQWDFLQARMDEAPQDEFARRRARAIRWLYATGLRLSEIAGAKLGDLQRVSYRDAKGNDQTGWQLAVVGKGEKPRDVPVQDYLVEELSGELERHGFDPDVAAEGNGEVPVLARFDAGRAPTAWSASALAKSIKAFMNESASVASPEDAVQLRKATTHWLRHTHGSHALNGRTGQSPVPIQVVQNNLGHASIATTSGYLTTERDARLAAMRGFGKPGR